jgi:hypothetical protein
MRPNSFRLMVLGAAGTLSLLAGSSAWAAPVTSFTSSPVTDAGAIADDPNLAGRILNLMNVNVGGNDWTNSFIRILLNTGNVYNATNAVGTESNPAAIKGFWGTAGFRNGPFDSFVNSKGDGTFLNPENASILGGVDAAGNPTAGGTETGLKNTNPNATLVAYQWFNLVPGETGTFSVARFTLSPNATGTFFGQTFDSASGGVGTPFSGNIVGGIMAVPEPTSLGLLGLAGVALLRRRRTA